MSRWIKEDASDGAKYMRNWGETEAGKAYKLRQREYSKKWRRENREKFLETQQKCYQKARFEVLSYYSKGEPKCACCGERGIEFLTIDHIDGNGSEHRRQIDPERKIGGNGFVYWLKKNNYPEGFQVLCANCNFAKRQNKHCPHQSKEPIFEDFII